MRTDASRAPHDAGIRRACNFFQLTHAEPGYVDASHLRSLLHLATRPRSRDRAAACPGYWQLGNLNDAMRVFQLNEPVFCRYSVVYQNVQSSVGSTVMAL